MAYGKLFLISTLFALAASGAVADPQTYTCDEKLTGFGDEVSFSGAQLEIKKNGDKEFKCQYGSEEQGKSGGAFYIWPPAETECAFKGQEATAILGKTRLSCQHESPSDCVLECKPVESKGSKTKKK